MGYETPNIATKTATYCHILRIQTQNMGNPVARLLLPRLRDRLGDGKAIVLLGARQVGKTTLLKELVPPSDKTLWLDGDDAGTAALFEQRSIAVFRSRLAGKRTLVIDEAQRIPEVGRGLKLITDHLPDLQVIATGSSAFELAGKVNEPLTGRKWEYHLYPLSFAEMAAHHGLLEEERMLSHRMVFGYYPDVVASPGKEQDVLRGLSTSYLYKDLLMWQGIKKPDKLIKLLQALAFQIGNTVSNHELGQITSLDNETVEKYILLLEQAFVIFRHGPFSRNLRNELKRNRKIYFHDNGIRNAIISAYQPLDLRQDVGALWENFLMSERRKHLAYSGSEANNWFWRTLEQQEIDLIEEANGQLRAFEFKWNPAAKARIPLAWKRAYPTSSAEIIHRENYLPFLGVEG